MKKLLATLLLVLAFSSPVSAHFLSTDGSIGAILHIDPDDDPIATQTATFFFDLKDKQNKFSLPECECTGVVMENGQILLSQPLGQASLTSPSFSFVFPKKDVYQIELTGTPLQPNGFQPFTIKWNIRVDRDPTTTTQNSSFSLFWLHWWHLGLIVVASIYVIAQARADQKRQKEKKKK